MQNFEPSEEQNMMREAIRKLVQAQCPAHKVREWDRDGVFPEDVYQAMVEAGYIAMVVPSAYGGMGSPMSDCAILYEEIARPSVDFATRVALQAWGSMILADFAAEDLCREVLPRVIRARPSSRSASPSRVPARMPHRSPRRHGAREATGCCAARSCSPAARMRPTT